MHFCKNEKSCFAQNKAIQQELNLASCKISPKCISQNKNLCYAHVCLHGLKDLIVWSLVIWLELERGNRDSTELVTVVLVPELCSFALLLPLDIDVVILEH